MSTESEVKRTVRLLLGGALLALLVITFTGCKQEQASAGGAKYHCPMHPMQVSDRPGDCPICNMKLVPIKESFSSGHTTDAGSVPGRVAIMIPPEKRQTIGLVTSPVEPRQLTQSIRTTATVTHDETRFVRIAPRFGGWVRELYVNYAGQHVEKGAPLFTVYSPELFATENEYLLAFQNLQRLSNSAPAQLESAQRMLNAARLRLELMGVGAGEIAALQERLRATDELLIRAPLSGHVLTKNVVEGKAFMAGETLYEIADLSHLWLLAYVFEYELPAIEPGQKAQVSFPYLNNKTYESEITFISPHLDPQTRRAEVRLELDNPGHVLKPDMWANVEIVTQSENVLSVPASAIIDTGTRHIAFVAREDEHLEPREVKLGSRADDYYQVLEGLKEGEKVVTRALFLVDSESQLKAAISGMEKTERHEH